MLVLMKTGKFLCLSMTEINGVNCSFHPSSQLQRQTNTSEFNLLDTNMKLLDKAVLITFLTATNTIKLNTDTTDM